MEAQGDDVSELSIDFTRPPVMEVAIGVQFNPEPLITGPRLGGLWDRWRDRYPEVGEQPMLPPMPPLGEQGLWFQFGSAPGARHWFLDHSTDHVIQLQNDRLVINWRQVSGEPYPRFPEVRQRFVQAWEALRAYLATLGQSGPVVNQVEVSYINTVDSPAYRLLAGWSRLATPLADSPDLSANWVVRDVCADATASALNVAVAQATGGPTTLTLAVRAVPQDHQDPRTVVDAAHDVVVRTFRDVTSPSMHAEWGATT